jgi:hypothetical protein
MSGLVVKAWEQVSVDSLHTVVESGLAHRVWSVAPSGPSCRTGLAASATRLDTSAAAARVETPRDAPPRRWIRPRASTPSCPSLAIRPEVMSSSLSDDGRPPRSERTHSSSATCSAGRTYKTLSFICAVLLTNWQRDPRAGRAEAGLVRLSPAERCRSPTHAEDTQPAGRRGTGWTNTAIALSGGSRPDCIPHRRVIPHAVPLLARGR